ncbi:DNA ligase 1-like isoform X2 [Quillaja saponaria]|uniref:DNA ligase 1-like isoform X2 n=1 Tax=Quillaja saponaria TaxID=32244 RepID=A0AAD7LZ35_QUISA|nr:DNA ligase 1-like isoform X2 [Quillaja saponaria]
MSRCFPFPPSGYMRNGSSGQALIESIKLQREWEEKSKADMKKEKKTEKKEKKRVKKEKRKKKEDKSSNVSHKVEDQNRVDAASCPLQKRVEVETEQLEKSGITEEHEQPFQSPCYLSDSTQSGNKRRRSTSQPNDKCIDHGNIIRIRLPLRKHREPEEPNLKDQLPSTSARADSPVQEINESINLLRLPLCYSTSADVNRFSEESNARLCKELTTSSEEKAGIVFKITSVEKETQSMDSVYSSLFQNLVPPSNEFDGSDVEDQDWLFGTKRHDGHASKRLKAGTDLSCSRSSTHWPRAQFLPEGEIYVLPYTIPF